MSERRIEAAGPVGLRLDPVSRRAWIDGREVALEPRGFSLLATLVEQPGRLYEKVELFERVWEGRVVGDPALTQAIAKLRRALSDAGGDGSWIRTAHAVGYAYDGPLADTTAASHPVPASASASRRLPGVRWRGIVLLLLVVAGISWWYRGHPGSGVGERLAIVPFDIDAHADAGEWGRLGLPSLLGDALSDRTEISVIAAHRVRRSLLQLGVADSADEQAKAGAIRDLFGVDHVLFARLDGQGADLRLHYRLIDADGSVQRDDVSGAGVGALARAAAQRVSGALDVAYAAGIPIRRIAADEFVNEAFARGMQSLLGGDARAAASLFETAIATAPESGWINYELGNARLQLGEMPAAASAFNRALELAQQREDRNLAGAAQNGLGQLAWRSGDLVRATQLFGAARSEFEAVGNRANLASAIGNLGILADNRGDLDTARALYEEALALFRQEHERAGESAVYSNLAVIARKRGELQKAADLQSRALTLQQQSGLRQMALFSATHLGDIQRMLGRWELAAEQIARARAEATALEDPLAQLDAALAQAWLDFDIGQNKRALRGARQALDGFAERMNPAGELRALLLLLQIDAAGAAPVDEALLEQASEIAHRLGDDRAQLELIALDPEASSETLASAVSRAQTLPDASAHVMLLWSLAMRNPDAQRWQAAFDLASGVADPRLQALIALGFARWMFAGGTEQGIDALLGRADAWRPDHPQRLELQACRLQRRGSLLQAQQMLAQADGVPGQRSVLSDWCPEMVLPPP